ncbi:hypothetical protein COLO4_38090 [Corchorus olitorius]|uniref:Uncharacterized protein n=1 Tax=Corchorus olitorius TaxID=93759 RepID=A0A1R3FXC8_9ROSI|nr:hypothetical protein COLO4_38090 [Corchorus olitorius]
MRKNTVSHKFPVKAVASVNETHFRNNTGNKATNPMSAFHFATCGIIGSVPLQWKPSSQCFSQLTPLSISADNTGIFKHDQHICTRCWHHKELALCGNYVEQRSPNIISPQIKLVFIIIATVISRDLVQKHLRRLKGFDGDELVGAGGVSGSKGVSEKEPVVAQRWAEVVAAAGLKKEEKITHQFRPLESKPSPLGKLIQAALLTLTWLHFIGTTTQLLAYLGTYLLVINLVPINLPTRQCRMLTWPPVCLLHFSQFYLIVCLRHSCATIGLTKTELKQVGGIIDWSNMDLIWV